MMSEDVASVVSPDDRTDTASLSDWSAAHAVQQMEYCQDFISKGPQKAEVQLRYDQASLWKLTKLLIELISTKSKYWVGLDWLCLLCIFYNVK